MGGGRSHRFGAGPTDAALGMAVVTDAAVPVRIRRALNIESGLNDGIATPFVTVFLAAVLSEEGVEGGSWALDAIVDIGLRSSPRWSSEGSAAASSRWPRAADGPPMSPEQLCVLSFAVLAYVGAGEIGGNGFVSAFTAGLVFGAVARDRREAIGFTEDASMFASFLVWVIFGASFAGPVLAGSFDGTAVVYAIVSLTCPYGAGRDRAGGEGFRRSTLAFMGWFGPRGLASVVFTLIAIEELTAPARRTADGDRDLDDPALGDPARRHRASVGGRVRRSDPRGRPDGAGARRGGRASRPAAPPAPDGGATRLPSRSVSSADRRSIRSCGVLVVRW